IELKPDVLSKPPTTGDDKEARSKAPEGRIEALCLFIAEVKSLYSNLNKVRLNMSALCGEVPSIVSLEEIDVNKRTIDAAIEEIYKQLTELEAERYRLMAIEKGYLGDDEDNIAIEWS
ncbi:uncharacterized protein H6S33_008045, partial [Morchella sextelata]|uniref:uncharacterized protein n=1 Tax=Morchella sextelata TaxID=1174677 RepID=UPI001D051F9E